MGLIDWRRRPARDADSALQGASEEPFRAELYSVSQLEQHARMLAGSHRLGPAGSSTDRLLRRLTANEGLLA